MVGVSAVGLLGNAGARLFGQPAVIGILPGLLLLVLGSLGIRSLSALLQDDPLGGLSAAFSMAMVGLSTVIELFLSNLFVSPGRPL